MSVSEPGKIITPWAESGLKNPIPPAANPATGRAGFDQGFSAINMTAKEAGGIPPFGQDFNGIFYEVTNILRYMQAGGQPTFDAALATAIGGYPKGAVVIGDDGMSLFRNTVDGNSTNPNLGGDGWARPDLQMMELYRRSYAEAGYNVIGTFRAGFTYVNASDVGIDEVTGKGFTGPAGRVDPGTNPTSGGFTDVSVKSLRTFLATNGGAAFIKTTSGVSVQQELGSLSFDRTAGMEGISKVLLARIKARRQAGNSPWGQPGPINILGDSITWGYFASYAGAAPTAGGMFYHRWASILARMLSAEFNTGHYITCNPNLFDYGTDVDVMLLLANIGTWSLRFDNKYTSDLKVGRALVTTTQGDYLEYKLPATFNECWVYYVVQPGGGTLSITLNGGAPTLISCDGEAFADGVARFTLPANAQGACVIRFTKDDAGSGPVGISAVSPTPGVQENGTIQGCGLNLFAAPGRRLQDLSEKVIQDSCNNASALIMALGFNDNPLNGSGQTAGRAAFTQRINWLIQYSNQYDTPIIVPDFSWKNTADSFTRSELRRLAKETDGVYIPLPDMVKKGTFPTDAYRISIGLWYDAAHPSRQGHKWIAESIAKVMGLSCTSKNDALRLHDYWLPLPLTTTYSNILTNLPRNLASYRMCADSIQIRTQIKLTAGGNFPAGVSLICGNTVNSMFWITPPCKLSSYYQTKLHAADENTGVILGYAAMTGVGGAKGILSLVRPTGAASPTFNGASSLEIDRWEGYDNV